MIKLIDYCKLKHKTKDNNVTDFDHLTNHKVLGKNQKIFRSNWNKIRGVNKSSE